MKDFNYYAPTEVVFGEKSEEQVAALVKKYGGTKVLVHYGGKSAERSGLLDKICGLLDKGGIPYVKLGGVVPNPRLSLAKQGIELCRQEGVDFTDPEGTALKGIEAMERFYHAIGMPVNIKELIGRDITDDEIREMTRKCSRDYKRTCGALKVLSADDMEAIYKMARG